MNIKNSHSRIEILFIVLKFSSNFQQFFNTTERIFINQERGQKMANESDLELGFPQRYEDYFQSELVESKIDFIIMKIENDENIYNSIIAEITEVTG